MSYGPQRNQSSTDSTGTSVSVILVSRAASSRPDSSSASCDSRLSTCSRWNRPRIAVLEVLELLEEHHGPAGAVGVDQRDPAVGLALQRGRDDREDRGDAGPRRDRAVVLGVRRVELGVEPPRRRHHLELVTDLQASDREAGEVAAGQHLDADPQLAVAGGRADRVAAPDVVACHRGPDREVLALDEVVVLRQLRRHVEGDADGVVGERRDRADLESVEHGFTRGGHARIALLEPEAGVSGT